METVAVVGHASTTSNLTDTYFRWLETQARDEFDTSGKTYWELLGLMHSTLFEFSVARDGNRIEDGRDLRLEFCFAHHVHPNALQHLGPGASFLEVLVGLSRRLAFMAGGRATGWAWQLVDNLGLRRMYDPLDTTKLRQSQEIIANVIYRRYQPDGGGGFFPLIDADEDQTQVELWYQMAAYVDEIHPEY